MEKTFNLDLGLSSQKDQKEKMLKYGFRIYLEDFNFIKQVTRFEILNKKNLEYNNGKAISEAIALLKEQNGEIVPRDNNVRYRPGRREAPKPLKITSTYLTEKEINYLKDYHFDSIFRKGNLDYSQMELFSELVNFLKSKYKGKIE